MRRQVGTTGAAGIALLLLFLGVVLNRYRVDVLPLRPQPEHFAIVFAGGILAYLVLQTRAGGRWRAHISLQASDLLLGAYLAVALVSSLLFPPDPHESVQYWARMVLAVAVYFLARGLMSADAHASTFRLVLKALLLFGTLEAAFGIVSWFLYPLGVNLGVDEYPLGVRGPGGIVCNFSLTMYGTLWEPNAFGSVLTTIVLIAATLFVSKEFGAWRKALGIAIAIMLVALGLNASRSALGTLAMGLVLILVLASGMSFAQKLKWALAAVVVILAVSVPSLELSRGLMQLPTAPGLAGRAPCADWIARGMPRGTTADDPSIDPATGPENVSNVTKRFLEGQTLASRLVAYQYAWNEFLQRPFLGNGANSFGQTFTTTAHTPGWISNMFLMALHDTGIVGFLILIAWLAWYGWTIFNAWRRALPSPMRTAVLALALGLGALLITYQVTTMLWFGFVWWYFAVLAVGAQLARNQVVENF